MKRHLVTLLVCLVYSEFIFSQTDTAKLVADLKTKLYNHSIATSEILSDPSYDMLHPKTGFRELIKENADHEILIITNNKEPGKKIKVFGIVKTKEDKPVANALVYLYQTDSRGWYAADAPHVLMNEGDFLHARLFGYVKTDKDGKFELHTVKPSGYPKSDLPAHIHVHVMAEGYRSYGTEFLFRDDERLKGEILNRAIVDGGMIGMPEKATAPFEQQFSYTMKLSRQ